MVRHMKILILFLGVFCPVWEEQDEHREAWGRTSLFPQLLTLHTAVRCLETENKDVNLEQKYLLNSVTHLSVWPRHAWTVKEWAQYILFDFV